MNRSRKRVMINRFDRLIRTVGSMFGQSLRN
ncbi:hypothetical protein COLO4_21383 [Corchorus olitorius]|uniref:Uncharacterized protein n=1 Tax=Corchorus olitorius TaxID=93759 RepID=A0A1R3ITK9_9ROSI|nr:hypothetical protein COLO4_21383 [Corchorus olitorius]